MKLKILFKTKKRFRFFFVWPLFVIIWGAVTWIRLYPDNRSTYFSMYDVTIAVTVFNGIIFAILNWKNIRGAVCIVCVTFVLSSALSCMSAFNVIVDHERSKGGATNGLCPGGFVYDNPENKTRYYTFLDITPYDDLMISLFAPQGDARIFTDQDEINDGCYIKSVLSKKIPGDGFNDVKNGFQYFARVQLINKKTGKPWPDKGYYLPSNETRQLISGKTDKDGYTEMIFTPKRESIQFIF